VICTIGVDYLKNKKEKANELSAENKMTELMSDVKESKKLLQPFNELANRLYPNINQTDALAKLSTRLDQVDKEILSGKKRIEDLTDEKNTIKTFDVSIYIEFSGEWTAAPYPIWYQPASPRTYLKWIDRSRKLKDIEFSSNRVNFKTINKTSAAFENVLIVQPGSIPLGELINVLRKYDQLILWFTFTEPKNLVDPKLRIEKIRLFFSINGSRRGEFISDEKMTIDLSEPLSKVNETNSLLNPTLTLDGNLIEALKIKLD
jgi:hypothetical protein